MPDVPSLGGPAPEGEPQDQCPYDDPALIAQWRVMTGLQKANRKMIAELAAMGVGVDPLSILETRLNVFIRCLTECMPPSDQAMFGLNFEAAYEQQIQDSLVLARSQARQQVMGMGGQLSGDQIAAMARMSGMHRGDGRPGG